MLFVRFLTTAQNSLTGKTLNRPSESARSVLSLPKQMLLRLSETRIGTEFLRPWIVSRPRTQTGPSAEEIFQRFETLSTPARRKAPESLKGRLQSVPSAPRVSKTLSQEIPFPQMPETSSPRMTMAVGTTRTETPTTPTNWIGTSEIERKSV